jgi:dephospho-CoA kinase
MSFKIALVGKICSGKTFIADQILKQFPKFQRLSFASKIKELASELFNMKGKNRQLLIDIGSKMREIDDEVWIKYTLKTAQTIQFCIIDDLRFFKEYENLRKSEWFIVRIDVSPELQLERLRATYPDTWSTHVECSNDRSENELVNLPNHHFDLSLRVSDTDSAEQALQTIIKLVSDKYHSL